jgi:NAD(P)-dependent dehydrogenase (short-subunit alcohol dehydrogenase family)
LQDKIAVVTAAGQGIGRAIAEAFLHEGAAVWAEVDQAVSPAPFIRRRNNAAVAPRARTLAVQISTSQPMRRSQSGTLA